MSENEHQDLKDAIVDLAHQIQRMADKQDEMIDDLEQWQHGMAKFIWSVGLAVTGLVIQVVYSNLF